ncbi:MAG: terminase large subunit domain-containing protein [Desulfobacteria bacterium]
MNAPAVQLYDYQRRWVEDDSRFKIALKGRQTGFSFAVALEVVLDSVARRTTWVLLSSGERQSKELMEKVALHSRAIGHAVEVLEDTFRIEDRDIKILEVRYPNGSKILGLPANADTARGFSGNVVLDEFAFHRDSRAIWQALYPTITRGFKLRVISTPKGKSNKFYALWTDTSGAWSKHKVDIYEAVEQGLPVNVDELRAGCESEDDWRQEFCCEFLDEADALLTYEMITACESDLATLGPPGEWMSLPEFFPVGDLYIGMDIGRKRDLSVIWLNERVGDVNQTRAVKRLEKTPFRIQRQELFAILSLPNVRRACIDATGIGAQLAEEAREKFGLLVEEIQFTQAVKEELAVTILRAFQDRLVRVPSDRTIREDLHSVKKVTTAAGHIRYDAERNADGHADHFWAEALSLHAGTRPYQKPDYTSVASRRFKPRKGAY